MSLVDDARRSDCYCYHPAEGLDCPNGDACIDLLMPRIVAALKAAERVAAMMPVTLLDHHDCDGAAPCVMVRMEPHHVWYCDGCDERVACDGDEHEHGERWAHVRAFERLIHDDDCPIGVLVAALRGEEVTV